jgi:hypothetical protein
MYVFFGFFFFFFFPFSIFLLSNNLWNPTQDVWLSSFKPLFQPIALLIRADFDLNFLVSRYNCYYKVKDLSLIE